MLRLTNLADYAVILMSKISLTDGRVNAQGMAHATGLPVTTVSKILNALGRAGLLVSHRGIKGGFALARSAETISVAQIVEAIDGPIAMTNCMDHTAEPCAIEHTCELRPHWADINGAVRGALDDVKLVNVAPKTARASAIHQQHQV